MQEQERLSRRAFGRIGVTATLATAGLAGSASGAGAASAFAEFGTVTIREPQVVTREQDGQLQLLYIPDDRYVVLDDSGRRLWEALAGGTDSMSRLIAEHVSWTGLPEGVAAYQVISFFDELRSQGYVSFALDGERDGAPLLDAPLDLLDGRAQKVLSVELPDAGLTLTQLHEMARQSAEVPADRVGRALFAATAKPGVSMSDLDMLLSDRDSEEVRRLAVIDEPSPDATIGELVAAVTKAARVVVVVVVVVIGDLIIIVVVVVIDGTGPAKGKSRSACKTMCV